MHGFYEEYKKLACQHKSLLMLKYYFPSCRLCSRTFSPWWKVSFWWVAPLFYNRATPGMLHRRLLRWVLGPTKQVFSVNSFLHNFNHNSQLLESSRSAWKCPPLFFRIMSPKSHGKVQQKLMTTLHAFVKAGKYAFYPSGDLICLYLQIFNIPISGHATKILQALFWDWSSLKGSQVQPMLHRYQVEPTCPKALVHGLSAWMRSLHEEGSWWAVKVLTLQPCDLWEVMRDRTIWILGDSVTEVGLVTQIVSSIYMYGACVLESHNHL